MQTSVEAPLPPSVTKDNTAPSAVYLGYKERADVLRTQLDGLIDQRSEEISSLRQMSGGDMAPARAVVTERIARLDKRIAGLEEQIAQADAQVATAAGVPGAVDIPRTEYASEGDMAGAFFGGATVMMLLSIIYLLFKRRRSRKRGPNNPTMAALPNEIAARMERLEAVAEATALEVERIGEGQRFVTKLLSEQKVPVQNKGV